MITRDLGDNVWLIGVLDKGTLKMVKIRVTGPETSQWLGTRTDDEYDPSCAVQATFREGCYSAAADSVEKDSIHVASVAWGILPETHLTGVDVNNGKPLPVRLTRYMGNRIWLLGVVDNGALKMVKIWARSTTESEWLGSRIDFDHDPGCTVRPTFVEACYNDGDDVSSDRFPVIFRATEVPVAWSIYPWTSLAGSDINGGTPLPVTLTRDLGNNEWLVGAVVDGVLTMAKLRLLGPTEGELLGTRTDADYGLSCAIQATFVEACYGAGDDVGRDAFHVSLAATEAPVAWSILPQTSLTGSKVDGGTPLPVELKQDLGNNVWLLGVVDGGVLKMVKIKVHGPVTSEWLGTRNDTNYNPSCAVPATFQEACWGAGNDLGRDAFPVDSVAWGILPQTNLTGVDGTPLPVMLTRDLGNHVWLIGAVDDGVLKIAKIRVLGPKSSEWIGSRSDPDYDPSCAIQVTFIEACYSAGEDLEEDAFPVSLLATEAPVSWTVLPGATLTGNEVNGGVALPITLMLSLGNNVWLVGVVDDGILKMVKIRVTGAGTSEWLGTRSDANYDPSCALQRTFRKACWDVGDELPRDAFPVSLQATDDATAESILTSTGTCRGEFARPLGDDSNRTDCPNTMVDRKTCAAQCNSGNMAKGTFICLESKIRLESACPGYDTVTTGDKVLFTLGVVASKCPSLDRLRTIFANALEVDRDSVAGVFCDSGKDVSLSKDDASLVGKPTAKGLTIGGEFNVHAAEVHNLLPTVAQLPDGRTVVGNRLATALKSAADYVGSIEQLHQPLHMPDQVIDVHKACRGDTARPLGVDSMGTNCSVTMVDKSTCSAQCKSGATANGRFVCLAGKVRSDSVCPGPDAVTMGDKVLFTLGAVASRCPSPEQLRTMVAAALEVDRKTVDGIFCEPGEEIQLSKDDAHLAGHPTARTLTIGGNCNVDANKAQDLLPKVAQMSDSGTSAGNRFATALRDAVGYLGPIEHLHKPLRMPDQVTDFSVHKACRGDLAKPLGDHSNGTTCPTSMLDGTTCAAACYPGATANGTFLCLAGKIRLSSVCTGRMDDGAVTLGDKVLFTLGVVSSECPSQEQLRTIFASALGVDRDTVHGVFCEAGEQVPLSEDDARLAGNTTARALTIGGEVHPDVAKAIPTAQELLERAAQLPDRRTAVGIRFATAMWDTVDYIGSVELVHPPILIPDQVIKHVKVPPPMLHEVPPPMLHEADSSGMASGTLAAVLVAAPLGLGMVCLAVFFAVGKCRDKGKKDEGEWAEV